MSVRIQLRRDTAANWIANNPSLREGEFGIELDTLKIKVGPEPVTGDSTPWNSITTYANIVPSDLNTTLGDYVLVNDIGAQGGVVGLNASYNAIVPGSSIIIEGPTADSYETTLTVTDPTADRTLTFPDEDGTIATEGYVDDAISAFDALPSQTGNSGKFLTTDGSATSWGTVDLTTKQDKVTGVSDTEISYLDGVTSAIQTQLNDKQPKVSGVSDTEIGYLDGVTSAIQTQLNDKQPKISGVSDTEIGYLDGVTSAIQTQLDAKSPTASPTFTGTPAAPTPTAGTNTTQLATTAFVKKAVDDLIGGAGPALDTLNELASAINNDASYASTISTALGLKAPLASPTFTGTVTLPDNTISNVMMKDDSVDTAEIKDNAITNVKLADNAVDTAEIKDSAVTSAKIADGTIVNADINASAAIALSKLATDPLARANHTGSQTASTISDFTEAAQDAIGGILGTGLTYNDSSNTITVDSTNIQLRVSGVSDTEIGYLDGVTSAIQTQLNSKSPSSSPTITGSLTLGGTGDFTITSDENIVITPGSGKSVKWGSDTVQVRVANVTDTEIGYLDGVTSSIQTQLTAKAPLDSPTFTGAVTLSGAPTSDLHAATKLYVDNVTAGINFHQAVHTATTASLSATYSNGTNGVNATLTANGGQQNTPLIIDGQTMNATERVLVKDQETTLQNGIYVVTDTGKANPGGRNWVLTRAADADNNPTGELKNGDFCLVLTGDINASYGYINNSATNPIAIGTDAITYSAFNAGKTIAAGTGLQEATPGILSIDTTITQTRVSGVSDTEIGYLDGVTSEIQGQLDAKAPLASPTFTGTVTLPTGTVTSGMILDGTITNSDINASAAIDWTKLAISSTVSATELGYVDGVTSAIQTQLDAKAPIAAPTFTGTVTLPSTTSIGNVSSTEIGYVDGVTSAIQTQLNSKAASSSPTITGSLTLGGTGNFAIDSDEDIVITPGVGKSIKWGTDILQKRVANISDTEIGYLDGVTSAIQTQLDAKLASSTASSTYAPLAAPALTGDATAVNLTVSGNLTVNGTTTNLNSTNLVIEDKNIVLGDVATPSNVTANGGGITLNGDTNKTFNWVNATSAWTSSEHIDLASGKSYYANGTLLKDVTETLTNKTLTSPIISTITNTGTLTLPTTTGTLALVSQLVASAAPGTEGKLYGYSNSTAASKTTLGYQAGNISTSNIVAVGYQAGLLSTAANNVAIGNLAFTAGTTGTDNTAIGFEALKSVTSTYSHTAIGAGALKSTLNSTHNTAVGANALRDNVSGGSNTAVGANAALYTTGSSNTAMGMQALLSNTSSSDNTAVGYYALYGNTTASRNSAVGFEALKISTGGNNTAIGWQAGSTVTTGSNNTLIGYGATPSAITVSNQITLGDANITTFRIPGLSISATTTALTVPSLTPTNAIGAIYGGTGLTSYASGDILYASATNTLAKLAKGTDGQVLTLASGVPSWAAAAVTYSAPTIGSTAISSGSTVTSISGLTLKDTSSTTVSLNTATTVDTNALAAFTTAKYVVSIKQGTKIRSSEVIIQTDGTSVDLTEFGITETGGTMTGVVVAASVVSTNAVLQVTITDAASTNATVKINKVLI